MALVSSICSFEAAPGSMGAKGEMCASIQSLYLTRQSCDHFDTLGPAQRLTGRASVVHCVFDSVGRERHPLEWRCYARQRAKRGVSL